MHSQRMNKFLRSYGLPQQCRAPCSSALSPLGLEPVLTKVAHPLPPQPELLRTTPRKSPRARAGRALSQDSCPSTAAVLVCHLGAQSPKPSHTCPLLQSQFQTAENNHATNPGGRKCNPGDKHLLQPTDSNSGTLYHQSRKPLSKQNVNQTQPDRRQSALGNTTTNQVAGQTCAIRFM